MPSSKGVEGEKQGRNWPRVFYRLFLVLFVPWEVIWLPIWINGHITDENAFLVMMLPPLIYIVAYYTIRWIIK